MIPSRTLEYSKVQVKTLDRKTTKLWFVKVRNCNRKPTDVINKKLISPTKFALRKSAAFVCNVLRDILKESHKMELLFQTNSYAIEIKNKIETASTSSKTNENKESTSQILNTNGNNYFPLLSKYNLPMNNKQEMTLILC
mmetsp:Transcript_8832/g.12562  ORF Transcript_8832/g.12562 Transcript_8832/m.12562 type:complete len:140 (+) Transcript_8832:422-841(+)